MASARVTATTRRSGTRSGSDDHPEISRARWGGVGLVIGALVAAVTLAMVSPSEPIAPGQAAVVPATPAPIAPADGRVPTEVPDIVAPAPEEVTGEWEIPITVSVPEDELPRRLLTLVIRRGDTVLAEKTRPEPADVTVEGIRLVEGTNTLTAALRGPGGLGPDSEPVEVMLDRTPPELMVETPRENRKTTDASISVSGSSEPGASVDVRNATRDWQDPAVVGPSGSFEKLVPLGKGKNRIVVRATDGAGNVRKIVRVVTQQDGRPVVTLRAPKNVKLASLPTNVRLRIDVSDADGGAIDGAEVVFSITIPGQGSETNDAVTDDAGRATWRVPIPRGGSRGDVILVNVKVTAPNGEARNASVEIKIS